MSHKDERNKNHVNGAFVPKNPYAALRVWLAGQHKALLEGTSALYQATVKYYGRGHHKGKPLSSRAALSKHKVSKYTPHQGKQECYRRLFPNWLLQQHRS